MGRHPLNTEFFHWVPDLELFADLPPYFLIAYCVFTAKLKRPLKLESSVDIPFIPDPLERVFAEVVLASRRGSLHLVHEPHFLTVTNDESELYSRQTLPDFLVWSERLGLSMYIEIGKRVTDQHKREQWAIAHAAGMGSQYKQFDAVTLEKLQAGGWGERQVEAFLFFR